MPIRIAKPSKELLAALREAGALPADSRPVQAPETRQRVRKSRQKRAAQRRQRIVIEQPKNTNVAAVSVVFFWIGLAVLWMLLTHH